MSEKHIPYLCGSTFFFLLLQARWKKSTPRERRGGKNDGLKDCYVMDSLIYAVTGNRSYNPESSLKKETSLYRECSMDGSVNIPFDDPVVASAYEYDVKNKYSTILERMAEFVTGYLDTNKYEMLVRYLLEVIDQDSGICDTAKFYVVNGKQPITKAELQTMDRFQIEPFLIGVLSYILKYRSQNEDGIDTLDLWGKKTTGQERKLEKRDLGASIARALTVKRAKLEEFEEPEPVAESVEETDAAGVDEILVKETEIHVTDNVDEGTVEEDVKPSFNELFTERLMASGRAMAEAFGKWEDAMRDQMLAQNAKKKKEPETVEAEVVDEENSSGAAQGEEKTDGNVTIIKQQTNVVQNGDHNVNLTNNGTININF